MFAGGSPRGAREKAGGGGGEGVQSWDIDTTLFRWYCHAGRITSLYSGALHVCLMAFKTWRGFDIFFAGNWMNQRTSLIHRSHPLPRTSFYSLLTLRRILDHVLDHVYHGSKKTLPPRTLTERKEGRNELGWPHRG